ncbi:MAG: bifunctional riboflavin kinase/FAD synthetase [Vicingaceae bacterium]
MKIYNHIDDFQIVNNPVVTTGTFDGVHLGHKKIIQQVIDLSKKINGDSVILTFFPHPRWVLFNDYDLKLLNTLDEKIELLKKTGVDHLIIHPFTKDFSRISSFDFIKNILVKKLNTKKLVIGYDHHFGKNREGTFEHLKEYGPVYGFEVEEIPALDVQNINISSTKIRNSLAIGEINAANSFLGYHYFLHGKVVEGDKIGRKIGFPTANIEISESYKLIPMNGVYGVKVELDGNEFFGMMNIGNKPTIGDNKKSIEVHIFNFDGDIYNKQLKIEFYKRIRNEQKFNDLEALKNQLLTDEQQVKSFFSIY